MMHRVHAFGLAACLVAGSALAGTTPGVAEGRVVIDGPEPRRPCVGRTVYVMNVSVQPTTFKVNATHKVTTDSKGEWMLSVAPGRYVASVVKDLEGLRDGDTLLVNPGATTTGFDNSITEEMCRKKK